MSEARVRDRGTEDGQRRIGMLVSPRNVEDKEGRDRGRIRGPARYHVNEISLYPRLDAHTRPPKHQAFSLGPRLQKNCIRVVYDYKLG